MDAARSTALARGRGGFGLKRRALGLLAALCLALAALPAAAPAWGMIVDVPAKIDGTPGAEGCVMTYDGPSGVCPDTDG